MFRLIGGSSPTIRHALLLLTALLVSACSSSAERAQSYYQDGIKLLAKRQDQKAAIEFKNAIGLKKDMVPAWRGLAQIEEATHHWEALVPILRTIVQLDPKDVETKLKLARLMLVGNAPHQALNLVSGLADDGDDAVRILALKAAIFYKLKDRDGAIREAKAAIEKDPKNLDAIMVLAALRLDSGDAKGALQILDADPSLQANSLGVQLFKLKIFEQLGDLPQVEALLRNLIELYPQEVAFRRQLVKFYVDRHRTDDAEKELRAIATADPQNTQAGLDFVRYLYSVRGLGPARQELLDRISAGGDAFSYEMALADLDFAQGDFANSYKLLESLATTASSPDHAVAAMIKMAEMDLAQKNPDAANAIITDILRDNGHNVDALKLRASIRLDHDQIASAISDLRQALSDKPRSTDLMLMLATAYERNGAIELAEKQFAEAVRISNFDPNVGLSYVAFLRRRGNIAHAEEVLINLAGRLPGNVPILSALAEVRLARQDWTGAQEIGLAIQRVGKSNGIAHQILGAALSGQHKYDESIAAFQNAVMVAPLAVQPMVSLVQALVRAKETDRAMTFLQTVLKSNPANAEAYVLLGSIQIVNNAPDQAMKSFMAAIEKQPKNNIGYRALSDFYLSQKNSVAALAILHAGLEQQSDDVVLHLGLGGVLERIGNYDGAISAYDRVLTLQPGSMVAANNLASLLADHRTDQTSLERAKSLAASLRQSQIPQFKDTLGWVNYRQGDRKSAATLLEQAAIALPNLALIHYHLGMTYAGLGQNARASDELKIALTKSPDNSLEQEIRVELTKLATP